MEGRTIARPDATPQPILREPSPPFNGGPDNCPARRDPRTGQADQDPCLQWRAGQLPGQTWPMCRCAKCGDDAFNGGPDNCPARHATMTDIDCIACPSMEGRTIARPDYGDSMWEHPEGAPSMEGRTIARPDDD